MDIMKSNTSFIGSNYTGENGKKYAKGRQDKLNHLGYKLQAKFFLPHLKEADMVLDFGCGNGSLAKCLSQKVKHIKGVEVNEYARNLAILQGIEVYKDLTSISSDQQFDAVISNHVLEHVPNPIETLKILRLHIKPPGKLIVMLPIDDFREAKNKQWNPNDPDHHLHTWTPLLIGNTLIESGFSPILIKVVTHAWTPKLFFLGDTALQAITNYMLSIVKKRRQLFAIASA